MQDLDIQDNHLEEMGSALKFDEHATYDTKAFMTHMVSRYRLLAPHGEDTNKSGPRLATMEKNRFKWICINPLDDYEFDTRSNDTQIDKNSQDVLKMPELKSKALSRHRKKAELAHAYLASKAYMGKKNDNNIDNDTEEDEADDTYGEFEDGSPPARGRRRLNSKKSVTNAVLGKENVQNEYRWRETLEALTKHDDQRVQNIGNANLVCISTFTQTFYVTKKYIVYINTKIPDKQQVNNKS